MSPKKADAAILDSPAVDKLLVICEEVTRATPEGARRFIEPAPGVLSRATSRQHNIIFGRRGSGKSSLLRKVAADLTVDRRPIAFVDMETFKGHTYPDVLISVLIKSMHEFRKWLTSAATAPASKTSFWKKLFNTTPKRAPLEKVRTNEMVVRLDNLIRLLEAQLQAPEQSSVELVEKKSGADEIKLASDNKIGAPGASASLAVEYKGNSAKATERKDSYVSHKIEYLHQHIIDFQNFFSELAQHSEGPAFLILDDLYHVRRADQAPVIDYFHRIAKGNGLWLKIGTIKHRTDWYKHGDPPIGLKLGDDAKEINLDVSLEKFETLRTFLRRVLTGLLEETPPLTMNGLINDSALDRLIIASGGVTRDFIGIFSNAINQARNRGPDHHRESPRDFRRAPGLSQAGTADSTCC